jgi:hypothetical protein
MILLPLLVDAHVLGVKILLKIWQECKTLHSK